MLKTVAAAFPDDPSTAGVVVAWLSDKEVFYASVVRYSDRFGKGKYVHSAATSVDLASALSAIQEGFVCGPTTPQA